MLGMRSRGLRLLSGMSLSPLSGREQYRMRGSKRETRDEEELERSKELELTSSGGQHPEWDEELRFTINEDTDDLLIRSESQQFDSISSVANKHTSLSSHTNPSHPTPPPKDGTPTASLNSSLSGSVTAQALASKSRKGPIGKKGGKSMKVACFADDAKEPDLIGEVTVPIDEVLKLGEVDGRSN
jgi:hypothetical protein